MRLTTLEGGYQTQGNVAFSCTDITKSKIISLHGKKHKTYQQV